MAKDPREYGFEGEMAMSQLKGIMQHAKQLHDMLKPDTDLPEWVQSKITLAYDYIQTAADYMSTEMNEETKWVKDKHGSGYTSSDGKREIVKHPKGWISRSTTDKHDYSDVFPTQKEAKAGKYAWAMKNEDTVSESKEFYADAKKRAAAGAPQEKLSPAWKSKARARASAAGRKYPNLVDNVWAARMQESVNEEQMSPAEHYKVDLPNILKDIRGKKKSHSDLRREYGSSWKRLANSTADEHGHSYNRSHLLQVGQKHMNEAIDNTQKNRNIASKAGSKLAMDPDTKTPDYFTAALRRKKGLPEEAPANSVGGGKVAGMGVGAQGEPGVGPKAMKRYKDKNAAEAPKAGRKAFSLFMQGN